MDCHRDERDQRERHQADVITLTGNKALQCFNTAYVVVVQSDPIVNNNNNNGTDASGLGGLPSATIRVVCLHACGGGQVKKNTLDGGGNEQPGCW